MESLPGEIPQHLKLLLKLWLYDVVNEINGFVKRQILFKITIK